MQENYPLLIDRIQSTFIDLIVIILLMVTITGILDRFGEVPDWVRVLLAGSVILYEPICVAAGCTLGNYLKGIRVRREADSSKRIAIGQSLLRYCVKLALGWISFLTINTNPRRRAIHDLASGSVMIKL